MAELRPDRKQPEYKKRRMETLRGAIVSYATDYIGKMEIKGNQGFKDAEFEDKMESVGFQDGYAWCCLFTELCWVEAYRDFNKDSSIINEEFSAGTVRTFRHFKSLGWTSDTPEVGDVVIWQTYKDGKAKTTGHAAIVVDISEEGYVGTIEGNTNAAGGREGNTVAPKRRKIDFDNNNGLRMLGFIKPN